MKKILGSWKLWTVLSAFIFVMTFSLVVYAATNLTTSSPYTSWKTSSTDKILDEDEWNTLMEKLKYEAIPSWAIMAFAGKTTCPEWWSKYDAADGRFLMWGTWSYGTKWWSNSVTLNREQIPPHSHVYKDTIWSESQGTFEDKNRWWSNFKDHSSYFFWWENDVMGDIVWSNQSDGDNRPVYWYRATMANICSENKDSSKFLTSFDRLQECKLYGTNPVDITNAYVKVLFCKKN